MFKICKLFGVMFVFEQYGKQQGNYQRIEGKGQPDVVPYKMAVSVDKEIVDNYAAAPASQYGTKSVGHHHK